MIGQEKLFAKLEKVLAGSRADQTEVVYWGTESGLTRYANSYIHQNVFEENRRVFFRSVVGKQVGVASTNSLVADDLRKALEDSLEIARTQPANPHFPGLAEPAKYKELDTFDEATARFSPRERATRVRAIIAAAKRRKFLVAGSFSNSCGEIAVLNSLGLRAYQPITSASVNMIPMSDTSSGYAAATARRVAEIDVDALAKRAVWKCDRAQNPRSIEPGEYEVLLEPPALAEMLEWLNYVSFGSRPYQQGTSFLSGRIGNKLTSDQVTIYDNGLDPKTVAFPFDFEGVPKRRVLFLDKGVAKGAVYDRLAAAKAGTASTGHAGTPDESNEGAYALNVFLAPGRAHRDRMISKIRRGVLVTRFHYINGLIDTRNSVLTGMTRDGTFLIENGEIAYGVKNLRFTDSFLRAFASVHAISRETERLDSWWSSIGCMTVPAVHLGSFRFSGKTEH